MASSPERQWRIAEKRWPIIRDRCVAKAAREVEAKRPFSAQWVFEDIRRCSFIGRDGVDFRVNNSYIAAYTRMLIRDYPECRPYIKLRRSRFDEFAEGLA